jgi:hypothetical protein
MAVEERRRIALHRAAAETWGEEVANTLVDLVAPSGHELATREDIQGVLAAMAAMDERIDARFRSLEERWDSRFVAMDGTWDTRVGALEERIDAVDGKWEIRFGALEERIDALDAKWDARIDGLRYELLSALDRRIADAVTLQTRTLVLSQLVALVVIAGLAFGLR